MGHLLLCQKQGWETGFSLLECEVAGKQVEKTKMIYVT